MARTTRRADALEVLINYLLELRYATLDVREEATVNRTDSNHNTMVILMSLLVLLITFLVGGLAMFLYMVMS